MQIEMVRQADAALLAAFERLMPQLSAAPAPTMDELVEMFSVPGVYVFVASQPADGGRIVGLLTLATFRVPSGKRAWIEDVVVDEAERGQGIGEALVRAALAKAAEQGAKSVELTSRPARQAANRLYQRLGFTQPGTNFYRYTFKT